jgi:hypothetical protein
VRGNYVWHGDKYQAAFRRAMERRLKAAAIHLSARIRADISQSGTLRYSKTPGGKQQKTIYNFTHSAPGNPPYKQTGHLRRSIAWELRTEPTLAARVGTNLVYGLALETGTKHMKKRPYLRRNLILATPTLKRILTERMKAGELPHVPSNQFRKGVMGRGSRGYS